MQLSHNMVWAALDNLARARNITASRLAVLSNLDATSFNKSKRYSSHGQPHWPSVETVAKVLDAMDISWTDFAKYFPKNTEKSRKRSRKSDDL